MKYFLVVVIMAFNARQVLAYKEQVHERITENVFSRLTIDFQGRLGVRRDATAGGRDLADWMTGGAFDEDDTLKTGSIIQRPVNHFLDPVHEVPLSVGPHPVCRPVALPVPLLPTAAIRADVWAGSYSPQLLNSYDLFNAREQYRSAVLGPNPGTRDTALKDLFYTLGHLVHLVEDMAQPEHTRNDQHLPGSHLFLRNGSAASLYEEWGLQNLAGIADPGVCNPQPCPPIVGFEGYPTVRLPDYASYFHTPERDANGRSIGKGIADFSNRNYVTQDTNYGDFDGADRPCFDYPAPVLPQRKSIRFREARVRDFDGVCCQTREVLEIMYESPILDTVTGASDVDLFHTFESSLDHETSHFDPEKRFYSLADDSYHTRAAMLIPRAIGYAAGFVEHFFRGKVDAQWTARGNGRWDLTITNRSSEPIDQSAHLEAIYVPGPAYLNRTNSNDTGLIANGALADYVLDFQGLPPGGSVTITGLTAEGLKPGADLNQFERRIVLRAGLGNERGAVISLVQRPKKTKRIIVDCWNGGASANFCPSASQLYYSWPPVIANMGVFSLVGGYSTSCTFKDPLPPGSRVIQIDADVHIKAESHHSGSQHDLWLNADYFHDKIFLSGGWGCHLPPLFEAWMHPALFQGYHFPDYQYGQNNTVTIKGRLIPSIIVTGGEWVGIEAVELFITYEQ